MTKFMNNHTVFADLDKSLSRIVGGICTDIDTNSEVDSDTEN